MSYGQVFHKNCPGEFLFYEIGLTHRCSHCDISWNGLDWSIAEYRRSEKIKAEAESEGVFGEKGKA